MRYRKTPQAMRGTYKLYDDNGNFVTEFKPGEEGVTEVDIHNLHSIDDHEVYINNKERRLFPWEQESYDRWKETFIADFERRYGRKPEPWEIPGGHRVEVSLEASLDEDEDSADKSQLEEAIAVTDGDEESDPVSRMREIMAAQPMTWLMVYRLVLIDGCTNVSAAQQIGISESRVRQIKTQILNKIHNDEILKNFFR